MAHGLGRRRCRLGGKLARVVLVICSSSIPDNTRKHSSNLAEVTWMGRRDAKPQKGVEARIPFLGLVTVVTFSYFIEPMG
jgi:hypothetical protein